MRFDKNTIYLTNKEYWKSLPEFGLNGHAILTSASATTPVDDRFCWIIALEDSEITYKDNVLDDTKSNVPLPTGLYVAGKLSELDIVSGTVMAYYGEIKFGNLS